MKIARTTKTINTIRKKWGVTLFPRLNRNSSNLSLMTLFSIQVKDQATASKGIRRPIGKDRQEGVSPMPRMTPGIFFLEPRRSCLGWLASIRAATAETARTSLPSRERLGFRKKP
jgi:hypothetical protein